MLAFLHVAVNGPSFPSLWPFLRLPREPSVSATCSISTLALSCVLEWSALSVGSPFVHKPLRDSRYDELATVGLARLPASERFLVC